MEKDNLEQNHFSLVLQSLAVSAGFAARIHPFVCLILNYAQLLREHPTVVSSSLCRCFLPTVPHMEHIIRNEALNLMRSYNCFALVMRGDSHK